MPPPIWRNCSIKSIERISGTPLLSAKTGALVPGSTFAAAGDFIPKPVESLVNTARFSRPFTRRACAVSGGRAFRYGVESRAIAVYSQPVAYRPSRYATGSGKFQLFSVYYPILLSAKNVNRGLRPDIRGQKGLHHNVRKTPCSGSPLAHLMRNTAVTK
ncbi:MAG TPA: hypothetical protein DEB39_12340 [Planctomycetaceae bacterium]|nr:hypothetical protein [Planctomycetaceae bacterium]